MSTPPESAVAYLLTEDQRRAAVAALYTYAGETEQYLRTSGYTPCAPDCPHCAPRVEHFAELQRELQKRRDRIRQALTVLDVVSRQSNPPAQSAAADAGRAADAPGPSCPSAFPSDGA